VSIRPGPLRAVVLVAALLVAGCGAGDEGSRVAALWRALAARIGLAPPDAEPAAAPAAPAAEADEEGVLAAVARTLAAEEEEADAGPGYWRYTEANGSLRFVQSLAEVPASARATAERIDTAARPAAARRAAPSPARAPAPAPPRARPAWDAPSEPARRADPSVVVYTAPWCGWCRKTLAWLDARGVDYENRDIERNPQWAAELREKTGRQSIPVVDVDGRIVSGFDPRTLEELL